MVDFPNPIRAGNVSLFSLGDGYTIQVDWFQALHIVPSNKIAYHIYYSTVKEDVFTEGPKYVSVDSSLQAKLINLIPGQEYFIAVRPVEYNPTIFDLTTLPIAYDNLRFYPFSLLRQDIGATDLIIPLLDVETFPDAGVVKIGVELVQYLAVDRVNNNLIVPAPGPGVPAQLVDQGGGHFYNPLGSNVGVGTLTNLVIVPSTPAPTETWIIRCVSVQRDPLNNPIPGTATFISIGSVSSTARTPSGDPITWIANGPSSSNGVFSFSISETSPPFREGDGFIIKVAGAAVGVSGGRGYDNTLPAIHTVGGFDGYNTWNPTVALFSGGEDTRWDHIFVCQSRFEYPNYAFTMTDGYHQVTSDFLTTDLSAADAANVDFPMYDFAGYHRTDPVQLLNGTCVGSYIGGEMGCIDGYGNYNILRGFSLQDQNTQRQDVLLSVDGRPACLLRKVNTGITCSCFLPSSENPDDRCPKCHGTKFVVGYEQYFNPRRSDGRILVRPSPTPELLRRTEAGLESEFQLDLWTLTVPTIKMRDVLVLFDQDNNEEFRYEVADVTRNNTILGLQGGQHMKTFRIRKTDPAYQIRVFRDTSDFPTQFNTSISFVPGIPPHSHQIVTNEHVTSINQLNQTTAVSQGHNHPVINGQVMEVLGHTHTIILPI